MTAALGDRALFPNLEPRIYANHAGISPASSPVEAALRAIGHDYGRLGYGAYPIWKDHRTKLREALGRMLGASSDDLGFVLSTSAGLSTLAFMIPWQQGDRVLLFEGEFPANVTPWQRAAATFGLEIDWAPAFGADEDPTAWLERIGDRVDRARLAAISVVQFQTGVRNPLRALADRLHARGAELAVDAVQAAGIVPLDVRALDVDYLVSGSHKWLMGLEGAGVLYARPDRTAALRPNAAGWMSHDRPFDFLNLGPGLLRYDRPIRSKIDLVEAGNLSGASFAALEASVGLIEQIGVGAIYAHVQRWHDALEPELVRRGFRSERSSRPEARSGVLAFQPPAHRTVPDLRQALGAAGISVAIPDGRLRFSPHWPNSLAEVPVILEVIDQIL